MHGCANLALGKKTESEMGRVSQDEKTNTSLLLQLFSRPRGTYIPYIYHEMSVVV